VNLSTLPLLQLRYVLSPPQSGVEEHCLPGCLIVVVVVSVEVVVVGSGLVVVVVVFAVVVVVVWWVVVVTCWVIVVGADVVVEESVVFCGLVCGKHCRHPDSSRIAARIAVVVLIW
jgi:hypothetical protein